MIDASKCQYCFLDYDSCTCCKYCGYPHGCDCHLEGEFPCTKMHPSDIYKVFHSDSNLCFYWMNFRNIEDIDSHVMEVFNKECWPERLKKNDNPEEPIS